MFSENGLPMPKKGQKHDDGARSKIREWNKLHSPQRKWPRDYDRSSRLYRCWRAIFSRHRPSHEAYKRYHDKPICAEWLNYGQFMTWALDNGYRNDLVIDRIDNALGYEPGNCRWVTIRQSARNKRSNLPPMLAFGEWKTPVEWLEDPRCIVTLRLLYKRIAAGWPFDVALSTPSQNRGPRTVGFLSGGYRPKGYKPPRAAFRS